MTGSESSDVIELDDLTTGLTTDAELEPDDGVKALRVTWIAWDSDFRTTDLRIGDRIVAVDGVSLHEQLLPGRFGNLIGQATEALGSPEHPATSGQQIVLTVMRAGERVDIAGRVVPERLYRRGEESALAPGGPVRLENDGFDGAWMGWYENFVKRMSYVLDDAWVRAAFDNRAALVEHDDWLPRVTHVETHHPGEFARCLRADWEAVRTCLAGTAVDDVDTEYRELGETRLAAITDAATTAYRELLAAFGDRVVPAFPMPTMEEHASAVGKVVVLPAVREREIVNDLGRTYAVAASPNGEHYLVQLSDNPKVRSLYATTARFRGNVHPNLAERFEYVGAIADRRMITYRDRPIIGIMVDVLAARVGDAGECVVDMREPVPDAGFRFAGESSLRTIGASVLADDATPEAVMAAFVDAIKTADRATFDRSFATWSAGTYDGQPSYNAAHRPGQSALNDAWERSRELITENVYDVRLASLGPVRRVVEAAGDAGRPAVDQVVCFVDHVGCFDGEYRTFMTSFVHRRWVLQRRDNGPWRITETQSL